MKVTSVYKESSRDDPADCKSCGRPLAGDNNTGICYECKRRKHESHFSAVTRLALARTSQKIYDGSTQETESSLESHSQIQSWE